MNGWKYKPAGDAGLGPVEALRSERREPGLVSWLLHHAAAECTRQYFNLYHRLRVHNIERLPRATPFVLVANHASHLDALALASALPRALRGRVFPIAAGDVFFESAVVSAFAAWAVNALPMWRKRVGRHALDDLKARLHSGDCGFILFPEGARSRDGGMLRWKPGIGMMVAATRIPVVPCRLDGCFDALRPETKVPRPRRISVRVGEPETFEHEPDTREGWDRIAERLRVRVEALGEG